MTLEEYLRHEVARGPIDFAIRASVTGDGVQFYIHPAGVDGVTADFKVQGNQLATVAVTGVKEHS
jgi:hypothetical protein